MRHNALPPAAGRRIRRKRAGSGWLGTRPGARALACAAVCALACDPPATAPTAEVPEPANALRDPGATYGTQGERVGAPPESARVVDYRIEASLDAEAHTVTGTVRMTWRNRTQRRVKHLPFHLYMNAFRAQDTQWLAESRGSHRGQDLEDGEWGYIDVKQVSLLARGSLDEVAGLSEVTNEKAQALTFKEDADPTTMRVALPAAVGPGEAVTVELDFVTQLPPVFARTGYHDDFHMVAQWFPKVGVLEEAAGWQAHTFTLNGEFYADFGNYEVELDVPADMVVGATGIRTGERAEGERKHLSYVANMVHDFAWVADPDYVVHWGEHEGIRIRQLIFPEFEHTAAAHLEAQKQTLDSMQARFGAYPWSTITIVHAPDGAAGAGGMEYPTLYTTSDVYEPAVPVPPELFAERFSGLFTTVHEFGHQYFQGLFASNEQAQPWLDEGMNSMSNMLTYIDAYGTAEEPDPWLVRLAGHELRVSDMARLSMLDVLSDPVDQNASDFRALGSNYGLIVYQKTSTLMLTLRNLVGPKAFDEALRVYAARARFGHPTGAWLEDTLVEVLGERAPVSGDLENPDAKTVYLDTRDYLDQALRDVSEVDFRLIRVTNRPVLGEAGWHRDAAGALMKTDMAQQPDKEADWDNAALEATVVLRRQGEFRVPVEVMVEFDDGSRETVTWDGQARTKILTWPGRRVRLASVDPAHKLWLEGRRLDNIMVADDVEDVPQGGGLAGYLSSVDEAAALAAMGVLGP